MKKLLMSVVLSVAFLSAATSFAYPESFRHGHFMSPTTSMNVVQQG